ncbi:MAG: hypothetical protein N2Z74_03255, partial [Syntrophales bacterium]|nr:hypothetical protein [Syntrophales bacterium]
MLWGRYRFHCTFREEAHLPAFKGLIFRNAFPRAVKRTVCAVGQKDCTDCFLARRCLYPLIRPPEHTLGGPTSHLPPPPPFIVEPPETRASFFTPETPLVFDLLLLGPANEAIGIYVRALEEMGRMGVGEKVGTRRGRFQIDHITVGERQYSPLTIGQCEPEEVCINLKKRLTASLTVAPPTPPEEVTVTLATPLLLPPAKEATVALPFVLLFRAAFTRIINLCRAYGNGAPKMDERRLMAQAHRIVTTSDGLHRLRARDLASPERSF